MGHTCRDPVTGHHSGITFILCTIITPASAQPNETRDHGHLKQRLYPMRGFTQEVSADVIVRGHGLVRNLRNGVSTRTVAVPLNLRLAVAWPQLAQVIQIPLGSGLNMGVTSGSSLVVPPRPGYTNRPRGCNNTRSSTRVILDSPCVFL